jgi:hypothetical protein
VEGLFCTMMCWHDLFCIMDVNSHRRDTVDAAAADALMLLLLMRCCCCSLSSLAALLSM